MIWRLEDKMKSITDLQIFDTLLGVHTKAMGSIEGRLQSITERSGLRVSVYDSLTDKAIHCYINDDLMQEAMKAFGKRVNVFGMISYDKAGNPKRIKVEEMFVLDVIEKRS